MPSVKITELPVLSQLSANNANTVFVVVDKTTNTTSQFSTTVLAQGLYANNVLNVGTANTGLLLPNSVAQFISNTAIFSQVNFQNINAKGSGDIVITADNGDNSNNYLDLGVQGSNMDADPLFDLPNADGYLYMHGKSAQKQGNLWIGTATSNTDLIFFTGAHKQANEVARIEDGVGLSLKMPIKFVDGTTQNTAASAAAVTLAAQANTIITQGVDVTQNTRLNSIETVNVDQNTAISIIQGVNTTQNTNITTANNAAWAAFTKANNALANTSGAVFAGNLNVTGNIVASGISTSNLVSFISSSTPSGNALVELIGSTSGQQQTPSQDGYMLHITGKDNIPTRVIFDAFGANSYPIIAGRKGRGVAGTPTATANNDVLLRISGNGWGTTGFAPLGSGRIDFVATENYTDTARGSRIDLFNCADGSNTIVKIASFNSSSVEFTGALIPEKGFIYNPVIYPNAQTNITIDMSNGPLVRAQTSAGLVVTLSNFVRGKAVELWVTNLAGSTQTFTHGLSAINSTTGSTTVAMPGSSTLSARYVCLDGTLANTMVEITKA